MLACPGLRVGSMLPRCRLEGSRGATGSLGEPAVLRGLCEGMQDYALLMPLRENKGHIDIWLAVAHPFDPSAVCPQVAVKVTYKPLSTRCTRCSKACCGALQEQQARAEIASLQRLSSAVTGEHENVISLIDAMEDETAIYTVLPYMPGGDVCDMLLALPSRRLPEVVVHDMMLDIVHGMLQLKSLGLTHGCVSQGAHTRMGWHAPAGRRQAGHTSH